MGNMMTEGFNFVASIVAGVLLLAATIAIIGLISKENAKDVKSYQQIYEARFQTN